MTAEVAIRHGSLPSKLEYAKFLATSGLLPSQYRDRPGNVLYAVEFGEMLGIAPMAAITGVHVIEGRPSASAGLISALVRRAGHRLRITGDDQHAVCEIVRADDPDYVFRCEWTLDRARTAGLANKAVWKNYPAAMLKARALTECARDACQEALSGLQYTPEELGAETNEDGDPVRATAEAARRPAEPDWASKPATQHERVTGQPEPAEPAEPARAASDEPVDVELEEPDWEALIAEVERTGNVTPAWKLAREYRPTDMALRERIQQAGQLRRAKPADAADNETADVAPVLAEQKQHRHMHLLWKKAGIEDRDERLAVLSRLVGRTVDTSKDLTYAEAESVIGRLAALDTDTLKSEVDRWLGEYHSNRPATDEQPAEETS